MAIASGFGLDDSEVTGGNTTDGWWCAYASEMLSAMSCEVSK